MKLKTFYVTSQISLEVMNRELSPTKITAQDIMRVWESLLGI